AQAAVRRHAAGDSDALRLMSPRGIERAIHERGDHSALEARAEVRDLLIGKVPCMRADVAQHRRLQSAEAEVEVAFELRGISIWMGQPGCRQRRRAIAALPGKPVDNRAARVPETEKLRDLVKRLTRRNVARPA